MTELSTPLWRLLINNVSEPGYLQTALQFTLYCLEEMTGQKFEISTIRYHETYLDQLDQVVQLPGLTTVAVYLGIQEMLKGHAVFLLKNRDAMRLANWLLDEPVQLSEELDPIFSSALAEMGNIMLSSFLNAISQLEHDAILPMPPTVIVDKLATVLPVIAITVAPYDDQVNIIETEFKLKSSELSLRFWLIPDPQVVHQLYAKAQ